jgi:hypothetical protein
VTLHHKTRFFLEMNTVAKDSSLPDTDVIAETDNYLAWSANEPDGETTYHLELNNVTLHFFREEWEELLELMRSLTKPS